MVEEFSEDYDCWDWFEYFKENKQQMFERKKELKWRLKKKQIHRSNISCRENDQYEAIIPIDILEEIGNLQPLGMFLYLTTETKVDFFVDQIGPNDRMERVLVYSRILVTICDLDLPGFHNDILSKIASCIPLLEHYGEIVRKLCTKSFRTMWTDLDRVDTIIGYMQTLLIKAQRAGVMGDRAMGILFNIWSNLNNNGNPLIAKRRICKLFFQELSEIFMDRQVLVNPKSTIDIYPTQQELQQWIRGKSDSHLNLSHHYYNSTDHYINGQRALLRHQFLDSLRQMVVQINKKRSLSDFKPWQVAFENVEIKLNRNFEDESNIKLIFIDVLAKKRQTVNGEKVKLDKEDLNLLRTLKTGTLLCLSTDYSFNNLVLATVSNVHSKELTNGYITIKIVRQLNIGNVYQKKLIMFETPYYFEAYQQSYRYLTNCKVVNFPMADYIVRGSNKTQSPAFLKEIQPTNVYESQKFKNQVRKLPLNESQVEVFERVLKTNFNLIQGPPGTGKSHLLQQLVKTLLENTKRFTPILVVARTKDTLDKFLLKLSTQTDSIVRFDGQSRSKEIVKFNAHLNTDLINPRLKLLYCMVSQKIKEHFERLQSLYAAVKNMDIDYAEIWDTQRSIWRAQEQLNCIRLIFQHYIISNKKVLAMTTTCAARMNFIFRFLKTRIVIFEEAGEILEANVLPCLTPYTEQVIMIGDHMQTKPFFSRFSDIREYKLHISMLERLTYSKLDINVLNIQHRMRNEFVQLLCPLIYKKLLDHETVKSFPDVRSMSKNLYFLDHREPETQTRNIYISNSWEAKQVYSLVRHLVNFGGYNGNEIAVLAAYSTQAATIEYELNEDIELDSISVHTIDGSQGLEADIIVLSLVRSNDQGSIGFLGKLNRICIALSRARYGLYIVGNMKTLANNTIWNAIRKILECQNAIGDRFPCEINV